MIVAVDERHLGIAVAQRTHDGHPGKSGADDDHLAAEMSPLPL